MQIELVLALISAAVALASAAIALWGQVRTTRLAADLEGLRVTEQRRFDAERATARYREPLARAAYDLQSRLYNILQQNLLAVHLERGDERERAYVIDNTAFLIAQYFAWTEIVRRDIQYIDLGQDEATRRLAKIQDDLTGTFQTDRHSRLFRVFAGEQRAIGERMIVEDARGPSCVGYATFLDRLAVGHDPLVENLRKDVRALSADPAAARPRLVALQNALVDVLDFLDPQSIRFPRERRSKVTTVQCLAGAQSRT
ncbi:MAG: hypothetical protein ACOY7P_06945 [Pseudomonadota bacterium]